MEKVLNFWFEEVDKGLWFKRSDDFDKLIIERFGDVHEQATRGELASWRSTVRGRLAEIIVLDQFSRNIYRNSPLAFANDTVALVLAQEALKSADLMSLTVQERAFLYLPFMHSESKLIHEYAVKLFSESGMENNYNFELQHKEIIDRFGRYPHRNAVLGRESTKEELEFLEHHKGF